MNTVTLSPNSSLFRSYKFWTGIWGNNLDTDICTFTKTYLAQLVFKILPICALIAWFIVGNVYGLATVVFGTSVDESVFGSWAGATLFMTGVALSILVGIALGSLVVWGAKIVWDFFVGHIKQYVGSITESRKVKARPTSPKFYSQWASSVKNKFCYRVQVGNPTANDEDEEIATWLD